MESERPIGVDERPLDDAALEALAEAHATAPPAGLRLRVLLAARADAAAARAKRLASRWRVVGSVAAGIALVLGGLLAREAYLSGRLAWDAQQLRASNEELKTKLDGQEKRLASLEESLATQAQVMKVLAGPRTVMAALQPQAGAAGAGRVVVDAASGDAVVVLAGLPPLPPGKTYELWTIRGEQAPEPAGLFKVAPDGTVATHAKRVDRPEEVAAFAVSIEPEGGSTSPTGPIVMVGKVAG